MIESHTTAVFWVHNLLRLHLSLVLFGPSSPACHNMPLHRALIAYFLPDPHGLAKARYKVRPIWPSTTRYPPTARR